MLNLEKYCLYLYNSSYIPIYLYKGREVVACYPKQDKETQPPLHYIDNLKRVSDANVTYTMTSFYSYYGGVKVKNSDHFIVLGPVNNFPYYNESFVVMKQDFYYNKNKTAPFFDFFNKIPQQNLDTFINTLLLINYTINEEEKEKEEIIGYEFDLEIKINYTQDSYEQKEEGILDRSYIFEREWLRYIETGNIEKLNNLLNDDTSIDTKIGVMADNHLRQWKNTFIIMITLASRAAMRGGVTSSTAYQLSNTYIQQMERLTEVNAILSLSYQAILDLTSRVARSLVPDSPDNTLHEVIKYVSDNTNKQITVTDVAQHVGFTRSSLSRKVKKELGVDLSVFIRQRKLEEAKDLLAFSTKSISEISNYLCFSSQSHFQHAFKQQFKVTPNAYRKSFL